MLASVLSSLANRLRREVPETAAERRYALRQVKQRLHRATFREAVITAYRGRCALSGLREPILLDAAHIVEDKHERLGQPVVQNGLPLAKTHHAAFDAHLIGIDPDLKIHVSEPILEQRDGPRSKRSSGCICRKSTSPPGLKTDRIRTGWRGDFSSS